MLQQITDNIYMDVKEVSLHLPTPTEPQRRVQALQYALHNRGMQRVSVRVDFSASQRVQLEFPESDDEEDNRNGELVFDIVMGPLQRRTAVCVLKESGGRAFVRVEYSTVEAVAPEKERELRDPNDGVLSELVAQSRVAFSALYTSHPELFAVHDRLSAPLEADVICRICRDINRFSRQQPVRFVDPAFSPSPSALWGSVEPPAWMKNAHGRQCATWLHLGDAIDSSWRFNHSDVDTACPSDLSWVYEGLTGQESWVCAIDSLSDQASTWCERWFGERTCKRLSKSDREIGGLSVVAVTLCEDRKQWRSVITDLFVPVVDSADGDGGMLCAWPHSGEFYAVILQKAYAKLCGSYAAVALKPTRLILEELSGVPTIELFPHGAWHHGGVLENVRRCEQRKSMKSKKKTAQRLVLVSFQAIDEHHCAFRLAGVSPSPSSDPLIVVRDPTRILHKAAPTKLVSEGGISEEHLKCFLTEKAFLLLGPTIFEVLVSHSNSRRRRKIGSLHRYRAISMQFAVSCSSLQTLIVRASTSQLSVLRELGVEVPSISVDRVDDEGSTRRLGGDEAVMSLGQCAWTAATGEYVVTVSAIIRPTPRDDNPSEGRRLTPSSVQDNCRLLFQLLDQDMDGVVSKTELLDLFRVHEQLTSVELAKVSEFVERFIDTHASDSDAGLNLEDLIDVYKGLLPHPHPTSSDATSQDDESVGSSVWRDLVQLLGCDDTAEIDVGNLWELSCVVSSDRDDIVVVGLN